MPSSLAIKEGGDPAGDPGYTTAEVTRAPAKRLSGEDSNPDVVPNKFGKDGTLNERLISQSYFTLPNQVVISSDDFSSVRFFFVYVPDVLGRYHSTLGYKVAWLVPIRDWPVLALLTS